MRTKFGYTEVAHKNAHEKLGGIDLESYTYHLSNQTHSARPKYAGDVHCHFPFLSAFSGVVFVSKASKFVGLHANLRSSVILILSEWPEYTSWNDFQVLRIRENKS